MTVKSVYIVNVSLLLTTAVCRPFLREIKLVQSLHQSKN